MKSPSNHTLPNETYEQIVLQGWNSLLILWNRATL